MEAREGRFHVREVLLSVQAQPRLQCRTIDDRVELTYVEVQGYLNLDERFEPPGATYQVWKSQPDGSSETISESTVAMPLSSSVEATAAIEGQPIAGGP